MRGIISGVLVAGLLVATAASAWTTGSEPRANFLHVWVTAQQGESVRAIWRPYAGAVASLGQDQQAALRARRQITHPDSLRRWADSTARDTIVVSAPAEFLVDMTGGAIVVESVGNDSLRVEAQQSPWRGPIVSAVGRSLLLDADGVKPEVRRRR
jgi:hypothetical protein